MKIAIEALGIQNPGGGRTTTLNWLQHMLVQAPDNQYLLFLSKYEPSLETRSGNVQQRIAPTTNRFLSRVWLQFLLPGATRGYDLVHFVKNLDVLGLQVPSVVTIHDLTILLYPELLPSVDLWYWKTIQKRTTFKASKVIAVSQTTANDLQRLYGLPAERIRVIYGAIGSFLKPATEAEIAAVRQKYGIKSPYFFHVGRLDRKKNLTFLVKAFYGFLQESQTDAQLVLTGEIYSKAQDEDLLPTIEKLGLQKQVIFTGRAPDEDLPGLFSGAIAAVYPTWHEGFGLAQVEALACGTPLIGHTAGAVVEAVGDAGILIDRLEPELFTNQMLRVYRQPELREQLRARGLAHAAQFNGERTARQTLEVYAEVAGKHARKGTPRGESNQPG